MTSRGENVRREVPPFSSSVGERKIMDHFVVSLFPFFGRALQRWALRGVIASFYSIRNDW